MERQAEPCRYDDLSNYIRDNNGRVPEKVHLTAAQSDMSDGRKPKQVRVTPKFGFDVMNFTLQVREGERPWDNRQADQL